MLLKHVYCPFRQLWLLERERRLLRRPTVGTPPSGIKVLRLIGESAPSCNTLAFVPPLAARQTITCPPRGSSSRRTTPQWTWCGTSARRKMIPGIFPSSRTLESSGQVRQLEQKPLKDKDPASETDKEGLNHRAGHKGEGHTCADGHWEAHSAPWLPLHLHLLAGRPQLRLPAGWR